MEKKTQVRQSTLEYWQGIKQIFKNKQNWLLTLYSGLAYSPIAVFGGLWGHPFLREAYHMSSTQAASFITLAFLGLAVGGPLLGLIADQFVSKRKVMLFGSGLSCICLLVIIYVPNCPVIILSALLLLFGIGTGAFMLGFAVGRLINPVALAGTVVALINSGDALFGAFTEPMIGKFLDLGWSGKIVNGAPYFSAYDYRVAMATLPIYLLIALLLLLKIKDV